MKTKWIVRKLWTFSLDFCVVYRRTNTLHMHTISRLLNQFLLFCFEGQIVTKKDESVGFKQISGRSLENWKKNWQWKFWYFMGDKVSFGRSFLLIPPWVEQCNYKERRDSLTFDVIFNIPICFVFNHIDIFFIFRLQLSMLLLLTWFVLRFLQLYQIFTEFVWLLVGILKAMF